ncbi:MAG: hypothetical protein AAF721_40915, partial [Myxococcota bacterium]
MLRPCLWALMLAVGCKRASPDAAEGTAADAGPRDLELVAAQDPCPSAAGWESVAVAVNTRVAGTLEIEAVDRWDPQQDLQRLMGPDDVRYALAVIANERVAANTTTIAHWAFGDGTAGVQPEDSDGCRPLRQGHAELLRTYEDRRMCTREVATVGRSGSASSLFDASCFADRGHTPHRFARTLPAAGDPGRWHWIAAWVWAPPGVG